MSRWSPLLALLAACSAAPPSPPPPARAPLPPAASSVEAPARPPGPVSPASSGWSAYGGPEGATGLTVSASSEYAGWPASNAIDGDPSTTWFSASGDSAARGTEPYLRLSLGAARSVRRVTVLGNRSAQFPTGYSVLTARLVLMDRGGNALYSVEQPSRGNLHDFEFSLPRPVDGVTDVYFVSLRDEGNLNSYGDVAISEIRVE